MSWGGMQMPGGTKWTCACLRHFDVNDAELGLSQLGAFLRRYPDYLASMYPRRFEELVGDVYKSLGYGVRLTKQTRDGGYDLVIIEKSSGEMRLIECKRYKKGRKVGVGIVRTLHGVQLRMGIKQAKIITTSEFTKPAMVETQAVASRSGYAVDLVDAEELTRLLGVYDPLAGPLSAMKVGANAPTRNRFGSWMGSWVPWWRAVP